MVPSTEDATQHVISTVLGGDDDTSLSNFGGRSYRRTFKEENDPQCICNMVLTKVLSKRFSQDGDRKY